MKKTFKRIAAFLTVCAVLLAAALPVSAADNLFAAGRNIVFVGKGAKEQTVVMDLKGQSEVKATFYPVTSKKMSKPKYYVDVEDVPDNENLKVRVVYNEGLEMYGIEITAKEMMRCSFVVKYLKYTGPNYEAFAYNDLKLLVINGEDHLPDPDEREDDDELYRGYRSQAGSTNVLEGLEACADYQTLAVDVSNDNRVPNAWLKALKKYPNKSLSFVGEHYSWTVRGSDIKSSSKYLSHYVGVSRQAKNKEEIEEVCGIKNVKTIEISGMDNFPASKAELTVELSGQSYQNTVVNVYQYKYGKVYIIDENVETDGDGNVTFNAEPGTYIVCKNKVSNAIE